MRLGELKLAAGDAKGAAAHFEAHLRTFTKSPQRPAALLGRALCAAADVVIAPQVRLVETLRLLHAREAGVPIVAMGGDSDEFLADYDRAHIAESGEARAMGIATVKALEKTALQRA